jgi:hypothetical protein
MAVHCVFFTPNAEHTCQVLHITGASPRVRQTQHRLESRYCTSGKFIACPLFTRVEQGLAEAQRFRKYSERRAKVVRTGDLQAAS